MYRFFVAKVEVPLATDDWAADAADFLFCDPTRRVVWVSLKKSGELIVGMDNPNDALRPNQHIVRLGKIPAKNRTESLGYIEIENQEHWEALARRALSEGLSELLERADPSSPLPAALREFNIDVGTCQAASLMWNSLQAMGSLDSWLNAVRAEYANVSQGDSIEAYRECAVYDGLLEWSRRQRVIFLFGGARSGLDTLVSQLSTQRGHENRAQTYVASFDATAWLNIHTYRRGIRKLRDVDMVEDRNPSLNSLLSAVAFSGYKALRGSIDAEHSAIDALTEGDHRHSAPAFSDFYFRMAPPASDAVEALKRFLALLDTMLAVAKRSCSIAVMLPFDELSSLLFSPHLPENLNTPDQSVVGDAARRLTATLADFAREDADFERPGVKADPAVTDFQKPTERIALILATRRPEWFLISDPRQNRKRVAAIPPLSLGEITECLYRGLRSRGQTQSSYYDLAHRLAAVTDGAPWIVSLLIRHLQETLSDAPRAENESAALERSILALRVFFAQEKGSVPSWLAEEVETYCAELEALLKPSKPALDGKIRAAWLAGGKVQGESLVTPRLGAWLATGLVWPAQSGETGADRLRAFSTLPTVGLRKASPLAWALRCRVESASDSELDKVKL